MDGADAGAGQHRHRDLGDHRQVDRDPVALLDAPGLQHIGEPADRLVQLAIGDVAVLGGIVALPQDRGLLAAPGKVPVDAVPAGVEGSVLIPGDPHVTRERGVLHLGKGLDPIEPLGVLAPEPVGVVDRLPIEPEIIGLADLPDLRMRRDRDHAPARHGAPPPRLAAPLAAPQWSPRIIPPGGAVYNTCSASLRPARAARGRPAPVAKSAAWVRLATCRRLMICLT